MEPSWEGAMTIVTVAICWGYLCLAPHWTHCIATAYSTVTLQSGSDLPRGCPQPAAGYHWLLLVRAGEQQDHELNPICHTLSRGCFFHTTLPCFEEFKNPFFPPPESGTLLSSRSWDRAESV